MRVSEDSPLRKHPENVSERQIVFLDGIFFSAQIASVALERLWDKLCYIDCNMDGTDSRDIASLALDAWSIIDCAHRLHDLIENLPGLPKSPWRKVFKERVALALELRNRWQHHGHREATAALEHRAQIWGALGWAKHIDGKPTGSWFLAVIGSDFKGSSWIFVGPANAIDKVDTRRIRFIHYKDEIYLSRLVLHIFEAVESLENDINKGLLRLVGAKVDSQRKNDLVIESMIQASVKFKNGSDGIISLIPK